MNNNNHFFPSNSMYILYVCKKRLYSSYRETDMFYDSNMLKINLQPKIITQYNTFWALKLVILVPAQKDTNRLYRLV